MTTASPQMEAFPAPSPTCAPRYGLDNLTPSCSLQLLKLLSPLAIAYRSSFRDLTTKNGWRTTHQDVFDVFIPSARFETSGEAGMFITDNDSEVNYLLIVIDPRNLQRSSQAIHRWWTIQGTGFAPVGSVHMYDTTLSLTMQQQD